MILFKNACIYPGDGSVIENGYVVTAGGTILAVGSGNPPLKIYAEEHDLKEVNMAPGLIDLQVYGGNGHLFNNDPTPATLQKTWESVRDGGACAFQITLSSVPLPVVWEAAEACREYWRQGGQGLLGLHLEGPYFNAEKRGAHPAEYIRKATVPEVTELLERTKGVLTCLTFAPEMMDDACLQLLLDAPVVLSAGHTNATFEEGCTGFQKGIRCATHLFNAMSAFQGRAPGMVGAVYTCLPYTSIIPDGVHVDYASVAISRRMLGDRLFIITDAVTDSESGPYQFRRDRDRYVNRQGTLAGSALTMGEAVRNLVQRVGVPLPEALRMASTIPAEAADLKGRGILPGRIAPGYRACFFFFDDALNGYTSGAAL
jgi:N-acetylglucosamine-6-phosphate deacetylase